MADQPHSEKCRVCKQAVEGRVQQRAISGKGSAAEPDAGRKVHITYRCTCGNKWDEGQGLQHLLDRAELVRRL